jgi:HSP20 family protein
MYTTYDVFDEVRNVRDLMERFFTENPVTTRRADFPFINLYEHDDAVLITALMPGVSNDSLNLQLVDNSLIIEGEKKSDREEKPYIRRERRFGRFQKSVRLPYRVDPANIEAKLKDGILAVRLNKSEDAKPKRIQIK